MGHACFGVPVDGEALLPPGAPVAPTGYWLERLAALDRASADDHADDPLQLCRAC